LFAGRDLPRSGRLPHRHAAFDRAHGGLSEAQLWRVTGNELLVNAWADKTSLVDKRI
jgi:hypothetical protein